MTSFVKPHSTAQTPAGKVPKIKQGLRRTKTTFIEKFLLISTVIILPFEQQIPTVGGKSVLFIWFALMGCYVWLNRPQTFRNVIFHPLFLAAYAFILVGATVETFHSNSDYFILFQFGQMVVGAILVASLCRDKDTLHWACYGFLVAGVFMSALSFFTSFDILNAATATNFHEASQARTRAFKGDLVFDNINYMAGLARLGLVVAFAFALAGRSSFQRKIMIGIAIFCLVGTLLPMSRAAFLSAIVSVSAMLFAYGLGIRVIALMIVLGMGAMIWVPNVVLTRMSYSTESSSSGIMEARAQVYTAALKTIEEYPLTGVGAGNFYGPWGSKSAFVHPIKHHLLAPHSGIFSVWVYWGSGALMALLIIGYQAYRCIPRKCGRDPRSLALLGLSISFLLTFVSSNVLHAKVYSLGLGLLVASRYWIWPQGEIPSVPRMDQQKSRHPYRATPSIEPAND